MTTTSPTAEIESPQSGGADASLKTRFYLVITAVLLVLLGVSFIGKLGLDTLSAVRASVGAEGAWSRAQGEAAYQLERYVDTGDQAVFEEYLRSLAIPLGLEVVRLELERPDPHMQTLRRAYAEAGIPRSDGDEMAWLFQRFAPFEPIQRATDIWARGDAKIAELEALGLRARDRIGAGDPSPEDLRSLKVEIDAVHGDLDALATGFSATLGDAARWAKGLLVLVLVVFTLFGAAVCMAGLVLVTRTSRRLEKANRALTEQNRQQTGRTVLHEHLQGQQHLENMLDGVLGFLTEFSGAQVGAAYVQEGEDVLRLAASHGIGGPDGLPTELPTGQGIAGQAARDGKSRLLEGAPVEHLKISSALSDGRAGHVFVLPLVFNDETEAVIELGAHSSFDPANLRFLDWVASDVALAVQTHRARDQVDGLLAETQQQAEELEAQQEELRQTNEELDTQQEELRQTNEELEAQAAALEASQTELEEMNAALEEKTEAVEARQAEVEAKNADLEETRKELLEKARKLETTSQYKSEFLANMSHELRTPLNSIILLSNILSDNGAGNLTEKQVEFAQTIHSSGADLLKLIDEVLDLSKVEAGRMELVVEDVEVETFLSAIGRGFEQTAEEKGLSFSVEIADEVPTRIETDERRLGQILKNLLSNAMKFTREGRVELRATRPDPSDAIYRGQPVSRDRSVAFSVTDTGIGLSEEQLPLIFEAFQQAEGSTDRKYGGTGLGLSISRELTELLGGEVFVDSTLGEGSRFTVVVPVTRTSKEAEPASAPDPSPAGLRSASTPPGAEAPAQEGDAPAEPGEALPAPYVDDDRDTIEPDDRCLLIVEDDRDFARVLLDLARERGFSGLVAKEGRAGLRLAEHYEPSAVLLDIGLPDIDGMSVVDRLKENLATRHIPVHVISAGQRKYEALKKGALGFVRKPTNVAQLEEAFERIEGLLSRPVRRLLVAVGDEATRDEIERLIGGEDLEITAVASGGDALSEVHTSTFDCMLLVADLPDMGLVELLKRIRSHTGSPDLPGVAIVDDDFPAEDRASLERYADSIILKDGRYPERVLDETALFLHRVEKNLPDDKRRMLRLLHDQDGILRDRTVLVVDDDMRNIFALSSILEERDMRTVVAKDGREALERLETYAGKIDLVLMDIMMPEVDGYEAMQRIRADPAFEKLPVIALTAKAMRGDRAKCIEAGASDYLSKPVDADRLLSMLRVWLYQ